LKLSRGGGGGGRGGGEEGRLLGPFSNGPRSVVAYIINGTPLALNFDKCESRSRFFFDEFFLETFLLYFSVESVLHKKYGVNECGWPTLSPALRARWISTNARAATDFFGAFFCPGNKNVESWISVGGLFDQEHRFIFDLVKYKRFSKLFYVHFFGLDFFLFHKKNVES